MEVCEKKILIVDSEVEISQLLFRRLTSLGYKVFLAHSRREALIIFTKQQPDLVILEVMLSELNGYELCREIRESSQTPIIILTALNNISDRVLGLEIGADDYIVKPFSLIELEARLKTVLSRYNYSIQHLPKRRKKIFKIGSLAIDMNIQRVLKHNLEIKLTNIEYSLLELLIENAGKKLSRAVILDNIWGYTPERYIDTRIVDVHIRRLRSKIEEDPSQPDLIITARGIGYMFNKNC